MCGEYTAAAVCDTNQVANCLTELYLFYICFSIHTLAQAHCCTSIEHIEHTKVQLH